MATANPGVRFPARSSSSISRSRSLNFWILVAPIGHSETKRTWRGTLKPATLPVQKATMSLSLTESGTFSSTKAAGTSTRRSSGQPTTWHSLTSGWLPTSASISSAATFSPPTFSMSLVRPWNMTWPASSTEPISPVWSQPSFRASRRLFRILVVAVDDAVAADRDLAVFARPHLPAVRIDDPDFEALERRSEAGDARFVGIVQPARRDGPRGFRQAVGADLKRVRHRTGQDLARRFRLHGKAAVHQADGRQVPRRKVRMVDQVGDDRPEGRIVDRDPPRPRAGPAQGRLRTGASSHSGSQPRTRRRSA